MDPYPLVNRCAIAVTPKSPFWDWVNETSKEIFEDPIVEKTTDSNLYLLPDYELESDMTQAIQNFVKEHYREIFVSELEAWNMDPTTFPEITFDRFEQWFSISSHTMIFDMVKKPLRRQ